MTKSIENLVSFPVNAQRNSFFGALLPFFYIGTLTQRTPPFSVVNINETVYDAAIVETNLLSRNITLGYINI